MPDSNKLGFPTKKFGEQVARIRTLRRLSRAGLVKRMYTFIEDGFFVSDNLSEGLIRTVEEGTKATISRELLELLALALECTASERLSLLLAADRNPHADLTGHLPESTELALRMLEELRSPEGEGLLNSLIQVNRKKVDRLTRRELFDILETITKLLKSKIKD